MNRGYQAFFGDREGREPGPVGVAPAARLATAPREASGHRPPSLRTAAFNGWTRQGERAERPALGTLPVRPSRGSYGPGDRKRHDGAPEGDAHRKVRELSD